MGNRELILQIAQKEIECGCYEAKINGVTLYSLIRDDFRVELLRRAGFNAMDNRKKVDVKKVVISSLKSLWQIVLLSISRKKYSTVFFSFPRLDKINGCYLDKFTDPVIDASELFRDDYIILDHGTAGVHPTPRIHQDKIVFIDILHIFAKIKATLLFGLFKRKHKRCFALFEKSLTKAFGEGSVGNCLFKKLTVDYYYTQLLKYLFAHLSAKRVMQPMRNCSSFSAANLLDIKTYEFQHGVTYGETSLYSGYRDESVMPDFFLAFGDNKPIDVYGIEEERIVNIGWALWDYLKNVNASVKYKQFDVLFISEPEITNKIINIIQLLAEECPESNFYLRPHPHEIIGQKNLEIIERYPNVFLQDKSINIMEVMMGFECIVGENSTVLYEALSMNKKVGKLFMGDLHPVYLEESDKESFWEIRNTSDFKVFLQGNNSSKKHKSVYSQFNKEMLINIL